MGELGDRVDEVDGIILTSAFSLILVIFLVLGLVLRLRLESLPFRTYHLIVYSWS